jgi:hypothetical protein
MSRIIEAVLALVKNFIPAAGVLVRDWAPAEAMLPYLGENVVLVLLAALLVRVVAPASEVIDGRAKSRGDSLKTFFVVAVPFTVAAAVFSLFVFFVQPGFALATRELLAAFGMMAVVQCIGFARDRHRLRGISLKAAEDLLVGVLGRVFLLALAVLIGVWLAFAWTTAFVLPFMLLKTIVDLWSLRPEALKPRVVGTI